MKNYLINQIKIILTFFLSLFATILFSKVFFLESTPHFNLYFLAQLKDRFFSLFSSSEKKYDQLIFTSLSAMTPIAPGIYAKEDKKLKTVYIRITENVQWQEKIIETNGKRILLRYPK